MTPEQEHFDQFSFTENLFLTWDNYAVMTIKDGITSYNSKGNTLTKWLK